MFQQKYLGFVKFKVWEYPFRTKAVLRQYYQFLRSKYIPAQTTSRQLSDNFEDIGIYVIKHARVCVNTMTTMMMLRRCVVSAFLVFFLG